MALLQLAGEIGELRLGPERITVAIGDPHLRRDGAGELGRFKPLRIIAPVSES
jgi:hypothetical protein